MGLNALLQQGQPVLNYLRQAYQTAPQGAPVQPMAAGNIDLNNRPVVHRRDKQGRPVISTVLSASFGTDQGEVLVPLVSDDGRILTVPQAQQEFRRTGRHLGIFRTPDEATAYARWLHDQQAVQYRGR